MENLFETETPEVLKEWDGLIHMKSVKGQLDWMELTEPLPCGNTFIEPGFRWNGASVGPIRNIPLINFPKWRHPIATCRHDKRCGEAKNRQQREIADGLFKKDISIGQTNKARSWWERTKGYLGVRIGALFAKY